MLKKNLSKKITSAVLATFFLCGSVASVCSASNSPKKRPKLKRQSSWMNQKPTKGNNKYVDWDDSDYDYDGKPISPEEDHEYKKWEKSALNDNNYVTNFEEEEEEEEEWNEPTKKGDEKVGNNVFTAGEENNNLNDNDDPSANAEECGTQNGNTAINNYGQNNLEPSQNASQRGNQGTVTPWHLIVFDDNNNE